MKRSCCNPFEVWGINAYSPNWVSSAAVISTSEITVPYDQIGTSALVELNEYDEPISKEIKPEIKPNGLGSQPQIFYINAVKVPSSFPYDICGGEAPIDSGSAARGGDGTFEVQLGRLTEHVETPLPEIDYDWVQNPKYCFKSRAIYVNGEQRWVTYVLSGEFQDRGAESANPTEGRLLDNTCGGGNDHGDHYLINIAAQSRVAGNELFGAYGTATCNAEYVDSVTGRTIMEKEYVRFFPSEVLAQSEGQIGGEVAGKQYAVNCESFGKEYYFVSSYTPGATEWSVARVQYEGARLGETTSGSVPAMRIFSTGANFGGGNPVGISTLTQTSADYVNPYAILLPSRRVWIESSVEGTDECHVVAKKPFESEEGFTAKLVCGQALNEDFFVGFNDEDEATGKWEGTLQEAEVQTVVIDKADSGHQATVDFPDEDWLDLQVRSYIHQYGKDCVLFDTGGTPEVVDDLTSDFEEGTHGDEYPNYLDHNNDAYGLTWRTGGTRTGDRFQQDNEVADHTSGTGKYASANEGDVTTAGFVYMEETIQVVGDDAMEYEFWYQHDNRSYGTHEPPWVSLTNNPEIDNVLKVTVNGSLVDINIDGTNYVYDPESEDPTGSWIDNSFVPNDNTFSDPAFYTTWKKGILTLTPGSNTIRFTQVRVWQDNGHMRTRIDDVKRPNVLTGTDINGRKRYYFVSGYGVREFVHWDWAQHDKDADTVLASRTSTQPDCIVLDDEEHVLIGNPHAVVRLNLEDGSLDETFCHNGYFRGTASPNNARPPDPPCYDPDEEITAIDTVLDPPWGAFDIPLAKNGKIHLRGMNAQILDATHITIAMDGLLKRTPVAVLESYFPRLNAHSYWSNRTSCWTLHDDGKIRVPHVQVVRRPTYYLPAWPEEAPYASPPYTSDFKNWNGITDNENHWRFARPRDSRFIPAASDKPRWSDLNWIVSRSYSDAFSRSPQFVWVRQINDPPNDEESEFYWHPDSPPPGNGPWGSALWYMVQAHFDPCGIRLITCDEQSAFNAGWATVPPTQTLCPDGTVDPEREVVASVLSFAPALFFPFTDFDAVDCQCDCCVKGEPEIPPIPDDRPGDLTASKRFTFTSDLQGFDGSHAELAVEWQNADPYRMRIWNDAQITNSESTFDVTGTWTFTPPDGAVEITHVEVLSVDVTIENAPEGDVTAHSIQVDLLDENGDPVQTSESDFVFLKARLPLTTLAVRTYTGYGRIPVETSLTIPTDSEFTIRVRYEVSVGDTGPTNSVEVLLDNLLIRAYYKT